MRHREHDRPGEEAEHGDRSLRHPLAPPTPRQPLDEEGASEAAERRGEEGTRPYGDAEEPRQGADGQRVAGRGVERAAPASVRATMATYEAVLARQREALLTALLAASRRLGWSAGRLAEERQRRLRSLLADASARSAFWRDRLAGHDLEAFTEADLARLPVLTKADLRAEFDEIVTVPGLTWEEADAHVARLSDDAYLRETYRVVATSGSGGPRSLFVYGFEEWVTFVAMCSRWRRRAGEPEGVIGSLFARNAKHVSGALHAFLDGAGERATAVAHLPATLPLPEIVAGLRAASPVVLQGYPSMVELVAGEALAGRLAMAPKWVSTCGEQCDERVRAVVRAAWGVEIYDYWGCSEGAYAFPCEAGTGMHLPDDLVIVEPVDRQGQPVPPGQPADRLLLTNLYNRTQPLIRFEVDDAVTVSAAPCACGCAHRRIVELRGRSDSVFVYGNGAAVHHAGMAGILQSDPAVAELQVAQTPEEIDAVVVAQGHCDTDGLAGQLADLLRGAGLAQPKVTVRTESSLERLWSGKLRQFEPLATSPGRAPTVDG